MGSRIASVKGSKPTLFGLVRDRRLLKGTTGMVASITRILCHKDGTYELEAWLKDEFIVRDLLELSRTRGLLEVSPLP